MHGTQRSTNSTRNCSSRRWNRGAENTNHDNDDADARRPNDTPRGMQGNAYAAIETTEAMERTEPSHPRPVNQGAGKSERQTDRQKESYSKGEWGKGVMQLVARHPEMPVERGQTETTGKLAGIMMEYQPGNEAGNRQVDQQIAKSRNGNTHAYTSDMHADRR